MQTKYTLISKPLQHFFAIHQAGSMHAAANQIGLTQPALTKSLKQLEKMVNASLFIRTGKGMELTKAGEVLLHYVRQLTVNTRYVDSELQHLASGNYDTVRIGAGIAWATSIIPDLLVQIMDEFSGAKIDLVTGVIDPLLEQLQKGEIDCLISVTRRLAKSNTGIIVKPIGTVPMIAVVRPNHPLLKNSSVSLSNISQYPWAGFYEDDYFEKRCFQHMAEHSLPSPEVVLRSSSLLGLIDVVHQSDYVTVVSNLLLSKIEQFGLVKLPLSESLWVLPNSLYYWEASYQLPTIKMLVDGVISKYQESVLK